MHQTTSAGEQDTIPDFQVIFNTIPGNFILLKPNPPLYTIVAISDEQLELTGNVRQDVVGKSLFEVYPENPEALTATGPSNLRTSLHNVTKYKKVDQMPVIRYDVPSAKGAFEERYWLSKNKPVLGADGNVVYIIHTTSDVTEQVKAEKKEIALRDIEKKYSLLTQAPVAVCILTGPENIVELANQEILKVLGKETDIIGKPLFESMPEIREQGFPELLDQVRQSGQPYYATEYPVKTAKNGEEELRYYNYILQPYFRNESDQLAAGVFSVAHDVTEQVLARIKVEESEARYRTLIDEAPIATALYSGENISIQYVSDIMLGYWGKGRSVIGKTFREALPELEDQPFPDLLEKVYKTGIPYLGQKERADLLIDGQLQPAFFNFTYKPLFNEEGKIYGIHHTAVDVTEEVLAQKRIEESTLELKKLANAMPQIVWIADPDGTVVYYNDRVSEFSGAKRLPDGSWHWESMLISEDEQPTVEAWSKAVQLGTTYEIEHRLRMRDGSFRWHLSRALPQRDADGTILKWFGTATDVHERKEHQEALEVNNTHLQRINNDLDNFIYTASHDLKAPISNIEGLLAHLADDYSSGVLPNADTKTLLHLMKDSVDRFKKTINSLTDVAKLQQENELNTTVVDVAEVIEEVTLDLAPLIKEADAKLDVNVPNGTSVRFSGKNLRSVIYNLLSNAIKYNSPERLPLIQIRSHVSNQYHVLIFSDNGLGMSPTQITGLFTMFKRFHDHVDGTGIGLYMVKKVVENAGGWIEVESQEGVGSTFRVYFPV